MKKKEITFIPPFNKIFKSILLQEQKCENCRQILNEIKHFHPLTIFNILDINNKDYITSEDILNFLK